MKDHVFYTAGHTKAMDLAARQLAQRGCRFACQPDSSVTHLLLGVPSFEPDGSLKGGGRVEDVLPYLNNGITVVGGNLTYPVLEGYKKADLLIDPVYVAKNADITAHCAIKLAMQNLPVILKDCQILIIGWGRIGKCLASVLKRMGAVVTVAARKTSDRAMLLALGYETLDPATIGYELLRFRVIYNTVPFMVLDKERLKNCSRDCLKIDLASTPGMDAEDVIWARGLPNLDAPESSGSLIARTILGLL